MTDCLECLAFISKGLDLQFLEWVEHASKAELNQAPSIVESFLCPKCGATVEMIRLTHPQ